MASRDANRRLVATAVKPARQARRDLADRCRAVAGRRRRPAAAGSGAGQRGRTAFAAGGCRNRPLRTAARGAASRTTIGGGRYSATEAANCRRSPGLEPSHWGQAFLRAKRTLYSICPNRNPVAEIG
jgi:hypothetical protein